MVDTTIIYEINDTGDTGEINDTVENCENGENGENDVKKTRGRPKKIKTPEELEQDRIKRNEYYNKYHKDRCERDPVYKENYRLKLNQRIKRYAERNKEKFKLEREELLMKSKLYDEMLIKMSL